MDGAQDDNADGVMFVESILKLRGGFFGEVVIGLYGRELIWEELHLVRLL